MNTLVDGFHRKIDYVRLSLTDKCNFQCFYCRPKKSERTFFPEDNNLNKDDIEKLFLVLGKMGVTKVKLTGGEPLLRKDIHQIVEVLSRNSHIKDLSLTTNGFFLEKLAPSLKVSGLHRLNISLDSLKSDVFQEITKTTSFNKVWRGILKALDVGFEKIKLNVVLIKGMNSDEICNFVQLAMDYPLTIRFIEFMPTKRTQLDQANYYMSNEEARKKIEEEYLLIPDLNQIGTGPSRYFNVNGGKGKIGFISPLSHNFCDKCNRIRITAKGKLRLCLFSHEDIDLLTHIRSGQWEDGLKAIFQRSLRVKPLRHDLEKFDVGNVESFVTIGG